MNISETLKTENRTKFKINNILSSYLTILKNKKAIFYILFLSSSSAVFFAFLTASPFLYINKFNLTPIEYSYVFGAGAMVAALSNVINIKMTPILGYKNIIWWICLLIFANASLLFLGGYGILESGLECG